MSDKSDVYNFVNIDKTGDVFKDCTLKYDEAQKVGIYFMRLKKHLLEKNEKDYGSTLLQAIKCAENMNRDCFLFIKECDKFTERLSVLQSILDNNKHLGFILEKVISVNVSRDYQTKIYDNLFLNLTRLNQSGFHNAKHFENKVNSIKENVNKGSKVISSLKEILAYRNVSSNIELFDSVYGELKNDYDCLFGYGSFLSQGDCAVFKMFIKELEEFINVMKIDMENLERNIKKIKHEEKVIKW